MVSPLIHQGDFIVEDYDPKVEAEFTAYLDIQEETEDFVLPLEEDIIEFLNL